MARKTVKVREGGPLAEKDHINPDPGFDIDPRRPVRLHADMGDTKKVKLGDPFQQLNVAATMSLQTISDAGGSGLWGGGLPGQLVPKFVTIEIGDMNPSWPTTTGTNLGFEGKIDCYKFYNVALTKDEVSHNHNVHKKRYDNANRQGI